MQHYLVNESKASFPGVRFHRPGIRRWSIFLFMECYPFSTKPEGAQTFLRAWREVLPWRILRQTRGSGREPSCREGRARSLNHFQTLALEPDFQSCNRNLTSPSGVSLTRPSSCYSFWKKLKIYCENLRFESKTQ